MNLVTDILDKRTRNVVITFLSEAVNMTTREHGCQSSRKLEMAPVSLKDGSHFGYRIFQNNKIVLISLSLDLAV